MTTKNTRKASWAMRCLAATTLVSAAAIVVAYFQFGMARQSLDAPRERQRAITPAQLIAAIDERTNLERMQCSALEQAIAKANDALNRLDLPGSIDKTELNERRKELIRYADLVNANEGAVLENGEYVSSTELRRHALRRRKELIGISNQIADAAQLTSKTNQTIKQLERALSRRQRIVDELDMLREDLVEKVNLLASETASSRNDSDQASLDSLRAAVERMQDIIEVRLEMVEEDSLSVDNIHDVLSEK